MECFCLQAMDLLPLAPHIEEPLHEDGVDDTRDDDGDIYFSANEDWEDEGDSSLPSGTQNLIPTLPDHLVIHHILPCVLRGICGYHMTFLPGISRSWRHLLATSTLCRAYLQLFAAGHPHRDLKMYGLGM